MDNNNFQKFLPVILIAVSIILGGYIMVKKGLITLPSFEKKDNVVNIGKNSVVDLLFTGDEFKLSYAGMDAAKLVDIAKFDKTEQWQGSGSIEENTVSGGVIMSLVDRDREKASSVLFKNLNLLGIDNIKFTVNLKSDPDNVESLNILFGNKEGTKYFRFPITNLVSGMNYFSIPKNRFFLVEGTEAEAKKTPTNAPIVKVSFGWDKIEKIQLELISRPNSKASGDIGWIRGVKEDNFTPDWNWDGEEHFLNLYNTVDGKLTLFIQNIGRSVGTLKKIVSVKDFSYSVKIRTIKDGYIGLFFRGDYKTGYGYYLATGGVGSNNWSISKYYLDEKQANTKILLKGEIGNFEFNKNQPFWLRVTAKGNNIVANFSLDDKDYTKLGEVTDNEFSAGGVGVAVSNGGAGYFDDFNLTRK